MKNLAAIYLSLLAALSSLLPSVHAHGYVTKFVVDSKSYVGNVPNGPTNPSPIRQISSIDPVKGASNPNLSCGQNAKSASMVADVNPGSSISFTWGDPSGGWPHNTGTFFFFLTLIILGGCITYPSLVPRPFDDLHGFMWLRNLRQI
jgi:Auxiliary Activity family 9 (formerly GH61)